MRSRLGGGDDGQVEPSPTGSASRLYEDSRQCAVVESEFTDILAGNGLQLPIEAEQYDLKYGVCR